MIKCEKGNIEIIGSLREIKADLSVIAHALYNKSSIPKPMMKEIIMDALETGFMTEEELQKKMDEAEEKSKGFERLVDNFISGLFDSLKKGEKDNGSEK